MTDVAPAAELAVVERGGFVESRHFGSAIVLDPAGEIARTLGDPTAAILPRSALKPFQALAVLSAGAPLDGAELAIVMGSHEGSPDHVALVEAILARASLTTAALQCPAALPYSSEARAQVIRSGGGAASVFHECSGKHAAFLLASALNGWDLDTYLRPDHPVQALAADTIERMTGEKISFTTVDGCGAPAHAVTLAGLARGIHRIAGASATSPFPLYRNAAALRQAAVANGWALDGPGRPDAVAAGRFGAFSKQGAEGVSVMAAPNGTTVAVKVIDGAGRAAPLVAATLLAQAGAVEPQALAETAEQLAAPVLGGGEVVGRIRAVV